MATFSYVDAQGNLKTVEAASPTEAMAKAPGIAKNSGVSLSSGAGSGSTPQSGRNNLQISSGDSAANLMQGRNAAQSVAQTASDPYSIFNQNLMALLQRQQTMGTKRFAEQGFNAQQAQNDRVLKKTDSSLIGASPGIQSGVRSASAGALDPTIGQAARAQQTFGEQISGFGNAIESAKGLITSYQARQDKERDDARSVIKDALTLGDADSLNQLNPDELKQLEKLAGYPAGYVTGLAQTIKERELELKRLSGSGSSPVKLSASAQEDIATMATLQSLSNQLLATYDRDGAIAGTGGLFSGSLQGFAAKQFGVGSDEEQQNRNLVANIKATIAKLRGGTSFTANEQKLLEQYVPTIDDSDLVLAQKLRDLNTYIDEKRKQTLAAGSGQIGGGTIRVRDRATGQTGTIPDIEFDPALYERI